MFASCFRCFVVLVVIWPLQRVRNGITAGPRFSPAHKYVCLYINITDFDGLLLLLLVLVFVLHSIHLSTKTTVTLVPVMGNAYIYNIVYGMPSVIPCIMHMQVSLSHIHIGITSNGNCSKLTRRSCRMIP